MDHRQRNGRPSSVVATMHHEADYIGEMRKLRMTNSLTEINAFAFAPLRPFGREFFQRDVRRAINELRLTIEMARLFQSVGTMPARFLYQFLIGKIQRLHGTRELATPHAAKP